MAQTLYYKQIASGQSTGTFYFPGSEGPYTFPNPAGFMTPQSPEWTVYAQFASGTATGVIKIETAPILPSSVYGGTWAQVGSDVASGDNVVKVANVNGSYSALRARISTAIGGGTVDIWVLGADQS